MVVWVFYAKTQTTIEAATKQIEHTNLTLPNPGLPSEVGDVTSPTSGQLNYVIKDQYVITKNIAWAGDPFVKGGTDNGKFKKEWTFTGTYTLREVGKYTFKGLGSLEELFGNEDYWYIVRESQPQVVSSGGVITKTVMVGYSTKAPTASKTRIGTVTIGGITAPVNGVGPSPAVTVGPSTVEVSTGTPPVWSEKQSGWVPSTGTWTDSTPQFTTGYLYKLTVVVDVVDTTADEFVTSNPPTLPTVGPSYLVKQTAISATSVTYEVYYSLKTHVTSVALTGITAPTDGTGITNPTVTTVTSGVDSGSIAAVWQEELSTDNWGTPSPATFSNAKNYRLKVTLPANATSDFIGLTITTSSATATPDDIDAAPEFADPSDPTEAIIYLYYDVS
jgi:hypothetical protein